MLISFVAIFTIKFESKVIQKLQARKNKDNLMQKYELFYGLKENFKLQHKKKCIKKVTNLILNHKLGFIILIMSIIYET